MYWITHNHKFPFALHPRDNKRYKIPYERVTFPLEAGLVSHHLVDLIDRMLDVDPRRRIKIADILAHSWFTVDAGGIGMYLNTTTIAQY